MGLLETRVTETWDRSAFALGVDELEVEEAVRALERVLDRPALAEETRQALALAVEVLRRENL